MKRRRAAGDPRWIKLRRTICVHGKTLPRGTVAFFFPLTGAMLTGDAARRAARQFALELLDEEFLGVRYG